MLDAKIVSLSEEVAMPVHSYMYWRSLGLTHKDMLTQNYKKREAKLAPRYLLRVTHQGCITSSDPAFPRKVLVLKTPHITRAKYRQLHHTCHNSLCINPNHLKWKLDEYDRTHINNLLPYKPLAEIAHIYGLSQDQLQAFFYR